MSGGRHSECTILGPMRSGSVCFDGLDVSNSSFQEVGTRAFLDKYLLLAPRPGRRYPSPIWRHHWPQAAGRVTAIDPYAEGIARAKEDLPAEWRGRVEFQQAAFEDFAASSPGAIYDLVILSWSLC